MPHQSAVGAAGITGRVQAQANGCAREPGRGVRGCHGAERLDTHRGVRRLGRIYTDEPDGVARPIYPYADGVAVDDTVNLGGA